MIYQFLSLLVAHWLADFVFQTHWQSINKSKNNVALFRHVMIYTFIIGAFCAIIIFPFDIRVTVFVAINGVLHFITDYFTSRLNAYLWAKKDVHNFFVSVGFDQLIHQLTLAGTMIWIFM